MISQPREDLEFMQETNMTLLVRFKRIISILWVKVLEVLSLL